MTFEEVNCPECGSPMALRTTFKFPYDNGKPRRFWGCSRYPECKGVHGAHPDGRPLGIPGDGPTKAARMVAHDAFDSLWKSGEMTRKQAYRAMQVALGMTEDQAHIGKFDAATCDRVVAWIEGLREGAQR